MRHKRILPKQFGRLVFVAFVCLMLGAAYFKLYYPAIFHSDSAAHYVLARAMLEEKSLIPTGFMYGNQIILFRNNIPIALVLAAGLTGYKAYALGSCLALSVYGVLTFLAIDALVENFAATMLIVTLLFVPFGYQEADYILGQQSHLSNVVLSLIIVIFSYRAAGEKSLRSYFIAIVSMFLMTIESPIRSLFVLIPVVGVTIAFNYRDIRQVGGGVIVGIGLYATAFVINKYLVGHRQVVGLPVPDLSTAETFIDRLSGLSNILVNRYFGFEAFLNAKGTPINLTLYASKTLVLVVFSCSVVAWFARLILGTELRYGLNSHKFPEFLRPIGYMTTVSTLGMVSGLWMVAALNHDQIEVRHFLWALFVTKFTILYMIVLMAWGSNGLVTIKALILMFCFILASTPLSSLIIQEKYAEHASSVERNLNWAFLNKLRTATQKYNISKIYGTHWNSLLYEVLVPPVAAAVLWPSKQSVQFAEWLNKTDRKCVIGDVLYVVGIGNSDSMLAENVLKSGGRLIDSSGSLALYLGRPVWQTESCL